MSVALNFLVLVETGRTLRSIKGDIETALIKSFAEAVSSVRTTKDQLWRLEILSESLERSFRMEILTLVNGFRESLGQPEVAAEMAEQDGFNDEAIAICKDALYSTLGRWIYRIEEYDAKAKSSAHLESGDGVSLIEIEKTIGMDAKSFFNLSNENLLSLLKSSKSPDRKIRRLQMTTGGIKIGQTLIALKPRQIELLQCLVDANGEYVSLSGRGFRTRDVEALPTQVQHVIESQPGAGTRVLPEWLN
jgi:hypothetical protein